MNCGTASAFCTLACSELSVDAEIEPDVELLPLLEAELLLEPLLDPRPQGPPRSRPSTSAAGGCAQSTSRSAGEIVGVAGLLGSGSEDLPYALFGALPGVTGTLRLAGWTGDVSELTPRKAQRVGLALVPGDRKQQGAVGGLSVEKNMLSLVFGRYIRHGALSLGAIRRTATERVDTHDVRPCRPAADLSELSGGNQQKVVLALWLELEPRVLLLHEPTQGVDVATRAQIYEFMRARCAQGVAILWVSTDFDELATVCDRILLCADGVITGTVPGPSFTRDRITSEVYAREVPVT